MVIQRAACFLISCAVDTPGWGTPRSQRDQGIMSINFNGGQSWIRKLPEYQYNVKDAVVIAPKLSGVQRF